MGPEVEYFPNVSAICGTLQLNAIIAVLGSECQRTGRDGVTNSMLTGGVSALPPPGKSAWQGRETGHLWVQQTWTMGLGGTHCGLVRSCGFYVHVHEWVHLFLCFCAMYLSLFLAALCSMWDLSSPTRD